MNNLTETQKEAISSLVNLTEEFCNRELSQKAERLKELFPEAFAEPKQERKKIVVEVSYDGYFNTSASNLIRIIEDNCREDIGLEVKELEVKELPELYTAEDVKEFGLISRNGRSRSIDESFEDWKKSKTIAK